MKTQKTNLKLAKAAGIAALGVISLAGFQAKANLIVNGDFENPVLGNVNPNDISVGSPALPGWIVGGPNGSSVNVNHVGSGFAYWPGNTSQWLDLTGSTGGAWIEQTIATTANTKYLLTLDSFNGSLNYHVGGSPQAHAFDISATGNSTLQVVLAPGTGTTISYLFTAIGGSTTLRFSEATGFDSNAGWIDNVDVAAVVPEASTVIAGALLLLPFGAGAIRSLRKNATA